MCLVRRGVLYVLIWIVGVSRFLTLCVFLFVHPVWFLVQSSVWTFVSSAIAVFSFVFGRSPQQQSHAASARVRVPTERG